MPKCFPQERFVAVVDYNNDVIADSLKLAACFKDRLYGVRIDTSDNLTDKFFTNYNFGQPASNEKGVTINLVKALRSSLDLEGFNRTKIFVSGGFNLAKIAQFVASNAPVDAFGVGKAFFKLSLDFSLDAVNVNGQPEAKVGRKELFSNRLHTVH